MRLLKTISSLSLLFYLPLYAEELPVDQDPVPIIEAEELPIQESETLSLLNTEISTEELTIEELIEEVKNAPDDQKRDIMNQLKIQLKNMNKESREKAMIELSKTFAQKGIQTQEKQSSGEVSLHASHQPTFRYLQQDSSRVHQGEGQRAQGNNHKGNV